MDKQLADNLKSIARSILEDHHYPADHIEHVGSGEQSICYGAGDIAILINQGLDIPEVRKVNPYSIQQWMILHAMEMGVNTAEILAYGDAPLPYAIMQRMRGRNGQDVKNATQSQIAEWFRSMGAEVRKINRITVNGYGEFVPTSNGGYQGRYSSWSEYLDACIARYLFPEERDQDSQHVRALFMSQGILSDVEMAHIADRLMIAKAWQAQPVLIHYDNRLPNLIVNGEDVALIDWGLSYAGIGLPQELIKVTEAPAASPEHSPMSAFLEGYGLPEHEWDEAIRRGTLMLVLDGLAMSYAWASTSDPSYTRGIRGWLTSIKRICKTL